MRYQRCRTKLANWWFFPIALCVFFWGPSPAHTEPAHTALVVASGGDSSQQSLLRSNSRQVLRANEISILENRDSELAGFDREATLACLRSERDCSHQLAAVPATWVLFLESSTKGPSDAGDATGRVVARLYEASTGTLIEVGQIECGQCQGSDPTARQVRSLVERLAQSALTETASQTFIDVGTKPKHATVYLDGMVLGPSGREYRVAPGEHELEVRLAGYRSARQDLSVAPNEHKALSVVLAKEQGSTESPYSWQRLSLGGAGLLVSGVGLYLLAIDGEPSSSDGGRDEINDTTTPGWLTLGGGAGAVGVALYLILRDSTDSDGELGWQIAPTRGGGRIGYGGRF